MQDNYLYLTSFSSFFASSSRCTQFDLIMQELIEHGQNTINCVANILTGRFVDILD